MSLRTEVSRRLNPTRLKQNVLTPGILARARQGPGRRFPFGLWFPLSVYLASRVVTAAYMFAAAGPGHRSGYADLATTWDGGWYQTIALHGFPSVLPLDAQGQVAENAWAFSPVYPLLVRALMAVTGLGFPVVAPTLSLVLGAAAVVVVFTLLERAVNRFYACACVILLCTFMAAPVLQIAYSESLALLLLASAFLLLLRRRYGAVAAVLLLLALTRPVVLAFLPVVIAHAVGRWKGQAADPFPSKDRRAVVLLAGWCVAATGAWPLIVAAGTRDIFGWTKTHEAWRVPPHFPPGIGWPASFLFHFGWAAVALLALVVLITLYLGLRRNARAWGPELRTWAVAYPAYLLLASVPGPSAIRWILLAFPLMWPFPDTVVTSGERRAQVILIAVLAVLGLGLQWLWVSSYLAAISPSVLYP
jgi:hypothetical protein